MSVSSSQDVDHGQDVTVVRIDDQATSSSGIMLLELFVQAVLDEKLDPGVDGECEVITMTPTVVGAGRNRDDRSPAGVPRVQDPPGRLEVAVPELFETGSSLAVVPALADDHVQAFRSEETSFRALLEQESEVPSVEPGSHRIDLPLIQELVQHDVPSRLRCFEQFARDFLSGDSDEVVQFTRQ